MRSRRAPYTTVLVASHGEDGVVTMTMRYASESRFECRGRLQRRPPGDAMCMLNYSRRVTDMSHRSIPLESSEPASELAQTTAIILSAQMTTMANYLLTSHDKLCQYLREQVAVFCVRLSRQRCVILMRRTSRTMVMLEHP